MLISEVMTPNPSTMDWQETAGNVLNAQFPAYIVEKNGLYYGIITKYDLNQANASPDDPIDPYVVKTALTTEADIDVKSLKLMIDRAQRELNIRLRFVPVLDNGRVVGIVTTNDMNSRYSDDDRKDCERCGQVSDDLIETESGAFLCPACREVQSGIDEFFLEWTQKKLSGRI